MKNILATVGIGSGARREGEDMRLSSYACDDPPKPLIANGQTVALKCYH